MIVHHDLGQAEAQIAVDACLAELQRQGKAAVVAVADRAGELIALIRMDGVMLPSVGIATNKAFTAARVRGPSGDLGRKARADGSDVHYYGNARFVGWDGGLPVMIGSDCVGAVAVSGLSGAEDLEIAEIGVAAIHQALAAT